MPVKSKAQARFLFAAEKCGELEPGTALRWMRHTKNRKKLPERVRKAMPKLVIDLEKSALPRGFSGFNNPKPNRRPGEWKVSKDAKGGEIHRLERPEGVVAAGAHRSGKGFTAHVLPAGASSHVELDGHATIHVARAAGLKHLLKLGRAKKSVEVPDLEKGGPPLPVTKRNFYGKHSMFAATHLLQAHRSKRRGDAKKARSHLKAARHHDAAASAFEHAMTLHTAKGVNHPSVGAAYREAFAHRKDAFHHSEKAGGLSSWEPTIKHMKALKSLLAEYKPEVGGAIMKALLEGTSVFESLTKAMRARNPHTEVHKHRHKLFIRKTKHDGQRKPHRHHPRKSAKQADSK